MNTLKLLTWLAYRSKHKYEHSQTFLLDPLNQQQHFVPNDKLEISLSLLFVNMWIPEQLFQI